jgi:uncharacterized lipoprotein YbaY
MASSNWTPFCPLSGQPHEALACGSCLAQNPNLPASSTVVREIEVVDLSDPPPRPRASTTVFARSQNTSQFSHYDRSHGAEQHRQSAIARMKKPQNSSSPTISATVVFYLLTQVKKEDSILTAVSCQSLGKVIDPILLFIIYNPNLCI